MRINKMLLFLIVGFLLVGSTVSAGVGYVLTFNNLKEVKLSNAGSIIPVKWSLSESGVAVTDTGVVLEVLVQEQQCVAGQVVSAAIGDANHTGKNLVQYDADNDQFIFNWKTSKNMNDQCYMLTIELDDDSSHYARFELK